jgi:hypothetical protein
MWPLHNGKLTMYGVVHNEGKVVGIPGAAVKYRVLIHQDSPLTTANDELGAVCKYSS